MSFAADQLALAHERMSPADTAAHALLLAGIVESQDATVASLLDLIAKLEAAIDESDRTRIAAQLATRQIASLFAAGRKKAARDFLSEAAAADIVRTDRPKVDRSLFRTAVDAWPDIFNPKGSRA